MRSPKSLRLKGKSTLVEIGVAQRGHAELLRRSAHGFKRPRLYETREIVVPPEKRIVNVAVQPSAHDYKPGAKAGVKLKVTDLAGKAGGRLGRAGRLRQERRIHFRRDKHSGDP